MHLLRGYGHRCLRLCAALLCLLGMMGGARAGIGPDNVLIVVNARSQESLEIGNRYRRARGIPYRQVCQLTTSTEYAVSPDTYRDEIEAPIAAYLQRQQLEEQITCLVLTRGVPQQVLLERGRSTASLLAAMKLRAPNAPLTSFIPNPYLGAPTGITRRVPAWKSLYLVTVLQGYDTDDVARLIAQGIAADGAAPTGRFLVQGGPWMSARNRDAVHELLRLRGYPKELPEAERAPVLGHFSCGIFSGVTKEALAGLTFAPGALADLSQPSGAAANNMDESQPPVFFPAAAYLRAGVTGLHAVISETPPSSYPSTGFQQVLLDRYLAGYTLAESYFASLPYLQSTNIIIGDPLTVTYAQRPTVTVALDPPPGKGMLPLHVTARAPQGAATIARMDLYVDDLFTGTIYEPEGGQVRLRLGPQLLTYTLPRGATLRALLEGLAETINTHQQLAAPDGVRAVAIPTTGSLQLIARTPGEEGNDIPVSISVDGTGPAPPALTARLESPRLTGGGQGPAPARGTLSFVGRRMTPGDVITLQIQQATLTYTIPADATMSTVLEALVRLVEEAPALCKPEGIRAFRDPGGMPYLTLEARAPGEAGNRMTYSVTLQPAAGSTLRAYPETSTRFTGGGDGSAASTTVRFALGDVTAHGSYVLDTAGLADGTHRLRIIAIDGSAAQVRGWTETTFTVANTATPPTLALAGNPAPASGTLAVPLTVQPTVQRADLYVDGQVMASATEAPFTATVPLTALGRGTHDLWVESVDEAGGRYLTPITPIEVLAPPEITRITPDHVVLAGGSVHRIVGTGFQEQCVVRLAGVPAKEVRRLSPNLLDVVADSTTTPRRGLVEVGNPDGVSGARANAFEYYTPRVDRVQILPPKDVLAPGRTTAFSTSAFDQYGHPLAAAVAWQASKGTIDPAGRYTAPAEHGTATITAKSPETKQSWTAEITIGYAPLTDGKLTQWLVLGPFPDPDGAGLARPLLPDEATVQPAHGDAVGALHWRGWTADGDFLNLVSAMTPNTNAVAYAHVYVFAPEATEVLISGGSDDGLRLWCNGVLIADHAVKRAADPNQFRLPVTLQVGWNRLLAKVDQAQGGWGLYLRLARKDGKPLGGFKFALDRPDPPKP